MNKLSDLIRKRALLGVAVFCVAAIATVGVLSIGGNEEEDNPEQLVDLNDQNQQEGDNQQTADNPDNPGSGDNQQIADNPDNPGDGDNQQVADNPDNPGSGDNQQVADNPDNPGSGDNQQTADNPDNPGGGDNQQVADNPDNPDGGDNQQVADNPDNPGGTEVLNPQLIAEQLTYNKENGLLWPVRGEILIDYSPDHAVYHSTLDQFSTSEAVVISSAVGTEVHSAAKGVVVSIEEDVRTGTTVTLAIGNNTNLVYGQLAVEDLKEGDILEAGELIGTVAEPTRYYVVEGPNLYFQVIENTESIDPTELLKADK